MATDLRLQALLLVAGACDQQPLVVEHAHSTISSDARSSDRLDGQSSPPLRPRWRRSAHGSRGRHEPRRSRSTGPSSAWSGSRSSQRFQSERRTPPPGRSDALHLRQGALAVEPVERLPRRHRRRPIASGQRDRLGRASQASRPPGTDALEHVAHRAPGSTATTSKPRRDELARQLPGSRGEVEHARARRETELFDAPSRPPRRRTRAARARTAPRPTRSCGAVGGVRIRHG